jgi:hypothetical protein
MSFSSRDLEKPNDEFHETINGVEEPRIAVTGFTEDEERRLTKSLLRKLDTRMLPMLAVLFLFSFLDRRVT